VGGCLKCFHLVQTRPMALDFDWDQAEQSIALLKGYVKIMGLRGSKGFNPTIQTNTQFVKQCKIIRVVQNQRWKCQS
jgi:hypothetical protein